MNGKKDAPARSDQSDTPMEPDTPSENVTGLDHVGSDDASQLPEESRAISLPIEEGDFNAQTQ
ncbi:hypothetical protein [Sphingobium mellinum]|uniref:hypothetical protein n=1 Tax=Sphingobium mellinum TaxID=1387166 RepID=UPI0030ED619A